LRGTRATEPLQGVGTGGQSAPFAERGPALRSVEAGILKPGMDRGDMSRDDCPYCRQRFEILLVKFALAGVRMISACPNCAMVRGDSRTTTRRSDKWWKRVRIRVPFGPA
jgi:hypothetical protein